jgi:hypothetical protein
MAGNNLPITGIWSSACDKVFHRIFSMSEVVPTTPQDFWRSPLVQPDSTSRTQACVDCGSEFMIGAGFCHACGAERPADNAIHSGGWASHFEFLRALEFQRVKDRLGLPLPSLIAFLVGVGCLLGTVAVGFVHSVRNPSDFQAVQLWRMQWLLGAVAAFAAGILLKTPASRKQG